ncbi:hypothetical protein H0194_05365 [Corynebacterium incognita]|uniref:ABC-2 type transporter transmembrane domain-containing protein n=1 Tax=Corynebacterium incognita TaxID=2754725 RepID=A0A7G7CS24_9CORY|nr:ABC transporter permease [Corynebacterium incognita]QNE90390.1 hypothetical protein H0194_05365 [Corynebacterium incognita]
MNNSTSRPSTKALLASVLAPVLAGFIALMFMWPFATMEPKDIAVAVVGPETMTTKVEETLNQKQEGLFEFVDASDRASAEQLIQEREAYGAIILGEKPEVLTASGAGQTTDTVMKNVANGMNGMLTQQAKAQAAAKGIPADKAPAPEVTVTDVAPIPAEAGNGMGLNMAIAPIAFGGLIGGALLAFSARRGRDGLLGLSIYSVLGGLALALVTNVWLNLIPGSFWGIAATFMLTSGAIASFIVGLKFLAGRVGLGLGVFTIMLLGNPLAGAAFPKEFLPGAWGSFGQLFPNGAGASMLRSLAFFPEASVAPQVWIMIAWITFGLIALGMGSLLGRNKTQNQSAE